MGQISIRGGQREGLGSAWHPMLVTLMVPITHIKLFPEASFGCVLRLLLLVQLQDPVLNVSRIHPRGIVWLGQARVRSQ